MLSNVDALTTIKGDMPFMELIANSSNMKFNNTYVTGWYIKNKWD